MPKFVFSVFVCGSFIFQPILMTFLYLPYKIISQQYGNKFCAALAISKIYFIRWSKWDQHPEICRFLGLRENDQNEDLMVVIVW